MFGGSSTLFGSPTSPPVFPKSKPIEKFKASEPSLKFWEKYFFRFSEVSLIDYLNALVPILEAETGRKFTDNQLSYLIDSLNYENIFKINKYESYFFLDKIWNNVNLQSKIWNEKFIPVGHKVGQFKKERSRKRAEALAKSMFSSLGNITMMNKPLKLKDYLSPLELIKVPSHRNLIYLMSCVQGPLS